jgi:hypothetical protein
MCMCGGGGGGERERHTESKPRQYKRDAVETDDSLCYSLCMDSL